MANSYNIHIQDSLEVIEALLPAAIAFDTDLDTAKDHLLASTKINTQLDDVAILYSEWL